MTLPSVIKSLFSRYTRRAYKRNTDKQHVSDEILSELREGIKRGESIPRLARRIRGMVNRYRNSAVTTARTETTRIQSRSRQDAFDRARAMGIIVDNEWVATSDSRTRDNHATISGEVVVDGELFSNGLRFPGDPNGPAEEVINCRCTLIPRIRN